MDKFFDKLGDILNSLMGEGKRGRDPLDPDEQEAWEELNAYLSGDEPESGPRERDYSQVFSEREKLRKDYATLGVPFGSPLEKVKKAYKRLLIKHHPDRNSQNPERLRAATEKTKEINIAFRRIRDFESGRTA